MKKKVEIVKKETAKKDVPVKKETAKKDVPVKKETAKKAAPEKKTETEKAEVVVAKKVETAKKADTVKKVEPVKAEVTVTEKPVVIASVDIFTGSRSAIRSTLRRHIAEVDELDANVFADKKTGDRISLEKEHIVVYPTDETKEKIKIDYGRMQFANTAKAVNDLGGGIKTRKASSVTVLTKFKASLQKSGFKSSKGKENSMEKLPYQINFSASGWELFKEEAMITKGAFESGAIKAVKTSMKVLSIPAK
jgi:hypothetical protein